MGNGRRRIQSDVTMLQTREARAATSTDTCSSLLGAVCSRSQVRLCKHPLIPLAHPREDCTVERKHVQGEVRG